MSLDALNLQALVLNSLAHLTAFFEVIETCLLFTLGVNTDLVAIQIEMAARLHKFKLIRTAYRMVEAWLRKACCFCVVIWRSSSSISFCF